MKLTSRRLRRTVAATAIAGAAILLPTVALAASGGASLPSTATAPKAIAQGGCVAHWLTDWVGIPGGQTAGSTYYQLEISDTSGATCTLYGFPGVSALKAGGGELGSPAARDYGQYTEQLITLQPGDTAHVILQITDVSNFPPATCHPAQAVALRVYAPGDYGALKIPFSFEACSKRGPIFLHVSTTIANTGIPGGWDN
jgi:hypothetical protein